MFDSMKSYLKWLDQLSTDNLEIINDHEDHKNRESEILWEFFPDEMA